jgi:hypothetical protein
MSALWIDSGLAQEVLERNQAVTTKNTCPTVGDCPLKPENKRLRAAFEKMLIEDNGGSMSWQDIAREALKITPGGEK